ncbi:ATPase components of ABC transporters with duplicated ATPase domains [Bacillus sp. JCM 19046]|nr:ATPase components of ABC transporters with duplicated ATPase domains [Bacillus sp. JCM 19046]
MEEKQQQLEDAVTAAGSDYGKVADLLKEKEELDAELEKTLDRWAELAEKVEV